MNARPGISVLLLFALLLQVTMPGTFFIQRQSIRQSVSERRETNLRFTFSATDLHDPSILDWEMEGREFRLKGLHYDVVEMRSHGDSVVVICHQDEQEDALNEFLAGFFRKDPAAGNEHGGQHPTYRWEGKSYLPSAEPDLTCEALLHSAEPSVSRRMPGQHMIQPEGRPPCLAV